MVPGAALAIGALVYFAAPGMLIGSDGREYCELASQCEGGTPTAQCSRELAGHVVRGRGDLLQDTASCSQCIRARACQDRNDCANVCRNLPANATRPFIYFQF
jgi:hypothetical protein